MSIARWTSALATVCFAALLSTACASPSEGGEPNDNENSTEQDLTQSTDAAIEGKLRGILKDITFMSESDFPYVVFEGEAVTEARLSTKLVRQKLQAAVKQQSSSHRDITPATCRSARLNVNEAIAAGSVTGADADPHDRQLMIALKTMRSQLRSVVGYTFGTNASGDQDDVGPVVFVYVGISKTTGKLIAIMTEAVFT